MSKRLPNREQAIQLLKETHCQPQVINHCKAVTEYALRLATELQQKGHKIDIALVEAGALLHDIGRSKSHTIDHALIGGQIAESLGLPEAVIRIIKRHVGAGITDVEAEAFGWPKDTYIPQTLEEKIVCYADKCVDFAKPSPIEIEIERLRKDGKSVAAERVRSLHKEITNLIGS